MTEFICALGSWQTALTIVLPILVVAAIIFIVCGVTVKHKTDVPEKPKQKPDQKTEPEKPRVERAASTIVSAPRVSEPEPDTVAPEQTEVSDGAVVDVPSSPTEVLGVGSETANVGASAKQPKFVVRYNKSFTAKLILATDELKEYYAQIANKLTGYKKVKLRTSWAVASFNVGREKLAKISIKGKSLCLYVALDPERFADTKYRVKDASDKKRFAEVPAVFKIKSERAKNRALEIIDILAAQKALIASDPKNIIKASDYPADTLEHLLARKLVKENKTKAKVAPEKPAVTEVLAKVTVTQAQKLITDVAAATLVTLGRGAPAVGKKFPVNIDVLSANFSNGDTVDVATLKAKKLVPQSAAAVKILARGTLERKLTVYADDFSADAVKMIALTGGKAIKGKN